MIRLACIAVLAVALFPSVAHANSVLTRSSGNGGTYTVTGDSDPDTVTATVSRELVVGRAFDLRAPDGQTYTFTTVAPRTFSSLVPSGCSRNGAGTTVTCAGAGADADHLVMHGGTGDDTLRVVSAGNGPTQGSYDTTDLEGDDGYDTLVGGSGSDTLVSSADLAVDTLQGGGGADTIQCDAGDTLSYDDPARTAGVTASVGQVTAHAGPDGDQISGACENLVGSPKADTLTGDDAANVIHGQDGDDTIQPGLGGDTTYGDGGAGDTLSCDDAVRTSGVTVDITDPTFGKGCDAGETARTYENVIGTAKTDTITTGPGANRVTALAGNDTITSNGPDSDVLDGGLGADTITDAGGAADALVFADRTAGVTVDLSRLDTVAGDAGDKVTGAIEGVFGSPGNDDLAGTAGANTMMGGDGDDTIRGGLGSDALDGGAGSDQVRFDDAERTAGVLVDLSTGTGPDGGTVAGVESVVGSSFDDTLTGTDGPETIEGLGAPDVIDARGGDDRLLLADGAIDTVDCGAGTDTAKRDLSDSVTNCEALDPATPAATPSPTVSPTPTVVITKVKPKLSRKVKARKRYSTVTRLTVTGLPAGGASVKVACKAPRRAKRSCAFKSKTKKRSGAGSIALKGLFKRRHIAPGTKVTVTVTGSGVKRTVFVLRFRPKKAPKVS